MNLFAVTSASPCPQRGEYSPPSKGSVRVGCKRMFDETWRLQLGRDSVLLRRGSYPGGVPGGVPGLEWRVALRGAARGNRAPPDTGHTSDGHPNRSRRPATAGVVT